MLYLVVDMIQRIICLNITATLKYLKKWVLLYKNINYELLYIYNYLDEDLWFIVYRLCVNFYYCY